MKSLVFDTGSVISLVMNNLLWTLKPLKKQYGGDFFIPKGVKKAGLYGLGAAGIYYGAKAAMHASVLKTDDPLYKALRKEKLLDDKAHRKQLAYWRKRNA